MVVMRSYGEACGIAHALDLVGERWALLIVRELLLGPKRFADLRVGLAHCSSRILTQRLRDLEHAAVVRRRKLPPPAASWVYELTDRGRELEPVLLALGNWGVRSPLLDSAGAVSASSVMLSLKMYFNPKTSGWKADYELRFGEDRWSVQVAGDRIEVTSGPAHQADAIIETSPRTLAALLRSGRLDEAVTAGDLSITGDVPAVRRLINAIAIPKPLAVATGS
jgi:DNA-binding HxlR family transcriptional regulator